MVYLLHIDTSSDSGLVAISADGSIIASATNEESRNHAASVNTMITDVLHKAGIALQQLHGIVVCAGPGSYTGLRIGLATAKGLCYVLDKPLFLCNKLTLLAYQVWLINNNRHSNYISLLTARDKEYFITIYNSSFDCVLPARHIMFSELQGILSAENSYIITDISFDITNELKISDLKISQDIEISLDSWAKYAIDQYQRNNSVNLATAEPFYLKQVYTHK